MAADPSQLTAQTAQQSTGGFASLGGGNQNLYTPPELSTNGIAGVGGYVSQPDMYISGMEAGSNLFNNWEASQRGRMAFAEDQTKQIGMAAMQRGGVVPPPTRTPGRGVQAIPLPTQSQVPMNGPNGQQPAAMRRGGVVPRPQPHAKAIPFLASAASRFSGVNGSRMATPGQSGYQAGGPVGYDVGGVVAPPDPSGVQSAIAANPGAPALPGAQQAGAADTQTVVPPPPQQGGLSAAAPAAQPSGALPGPVQFPASSQATAQKSFENSLEDFASLLHYQSLNDDSVPLNKAGIPVTGGQPQPGTPAAASDTTSGVKQYDVTGKVEPHSLSPSYWDETDNKIEVASRLAALAGANPAAVYASLDSMRTSYVQSHILRWLSTASRAQLDGDQKSMIQALRNANYYLPNGQNLNIRTDSNGQVIFQDPIYPYLDKDGRPQMTRGSGGTPNMIPANQQYIQMVGEAMLNPMNVQSLIAGTRASLIKQQQEMMQAQGQLLTGQGRAAWGQAALDKVGVEQSRSAAQNYRDLAQGDLDRVRGATSGFALRMIQAYRMDPVAAKATHDAAVAVDNLALGPLQQVPATDAQGNPSLSPAAGKVIHDSTRADPSLNRASMADIATVKGWAAGLVAANPRGMSPQLAANVATKAYAQTKSTHKGADGKTVPDVMIDRQRGMLHVWNRRAKQWENYPMQQGAAISLGQIPPALFQLAAGGASAAASDPTQSGSDQDFSNPPSWMMDDASNSAP